MQNIPWADPETVALDGHRNAKAQQHHAKKEKQPTIIYRNFHPLSFFLLDPACRSGGKKAITASPSIPQTRHVSLSANLPAPVSTVHRLFRQRQSFHPIGKLVRRRMS